MKQSRWLVAYAALCYLFLHLPVLVLIVFSFNRARFSVQWQGFTLDWYRRMLERRDILDALGRSILVATLATAVATGLGTLLALGLARSLAGRWRRGIEGSLYFPIVTPEIVAGISLLVFFVLASVPLGFITIVAAHVAFCLPFVTVVVLARLEGMDRSLVEAALMLGADELTAFRRVTLPALAPGVVAGALLAFILSFDDFLITFFVAGVGSTTLPLLVYSMVRRNVEPTINAVSTVVVVVTSALILLLDLLSRRGEGGKRTRGGNR